MVILNYTQSFKKSNFHLIDLKQVQLNLHFVSCFPMTTRFHVLNVELTIKFQSVVINKKLSNEMKLRLI